jgi:cysteine desulfurase/selenocysteine lyase
LHKHRINVTVSDGSGSLVSFQDRGITDVVRASVHYFNTEEEISTFLEGLRSTLGKS